MKPDFIVDVLEEATRELLQATAAEDTLGALKAIDRRAVAIRGVAACDPRSFTDEHSLRLKAAMSAGDIALDKLKAARRQNAEEWNLIQRFGVGTLRSGTSRILVSA